MYTTYDFVANFIAIQILFDINMTILSSLKKILRKKKKKANKRAVFKNIYIRIHDVSVYANIHVFSLWMINKFKK